VYEQVVAAQRELAGRAGAPPSLQARGPVSERPLRSRFAAFVCMGIA
jgi:hypothetical protein